jgi:hypothetical protein
MIIVTLGTSQNWPQERKILFYFFEKNSHVCTKSGNQLEEDLAKSGYKTNKEILKIKESYYMLVNH